MTGNFVDAETALRIGLANHVVPHDELLPFALQLAARSPSRTAMIAAMRHDWDETNTLPLESLIDVIAKIANELGFSGVGSDTFKANMASVVARARRQR